MSVTDKLAELRSIAQMGHGPGNGVALQLIAAIEALRAELIERTCTGSDRHERAALHVDKIITDAAPMLGESC